MCAPSADLVLEEMGGVVLEVKVEEGTVRGATPTYFVIHPERELAFQFK